MPFEYCSKALVSERRYAKSDVYCAEGADSRHRLLGTTLAGFLTSSKSLRGSQSSFFDEHWRSVVNRVDDPYVRVILSRIAGDGWESVTEEEAIPLLDRIFIAVNNLNDAEVCPLFYFIGMIFLSADLRLCLCSLASTSPIGSADSDAASSLRSTSSPCSDSPPPRF